MARSVASLSIAIIFFCMMFFFPFLSNAISQCNEPCRTLDDCAGQLICINGKFNDDPDIGTNICPDVVPNICIRRGGGSSTHSPENNCQPSGTLTCGQNSYPTYNCSPPVTSSTKAKLTNNDFSEGGDGGAPSECDGKYHDNSNPLVALSTGWYDGGSRCGKMIKITASNGMSVMAKVVDECDSMRGCDEEHSYQPPCENDLVNASDAVWNALGLEKDTGVVDVTWSMA